MNLLIIIFLIIILIIILGDLVIRQCDKMSTIWIALSTTTNIYDKIIIIMIDNTLKTSNAHRNKQGNQFEMETNMRRLERS